MQRKLRIFVFKLPDLECEKTVVFNKRNPMTSDTPNFLKLLQINTLSGKPTIDLYEFLNNIFTPRFEKVVEHFEDYTFSCLLFIRLQHYDKTIKRKIFTLQSNLKSLIFADYLPKSAIQEVSHSYLTCKILLPIKNIRLNHFIAI